MADRENVITALSAALVQMHGCGRYTPEDVDELEKAAWNALKLLETQQARVMTLEEVKALAEDDLVWYEHVGINRLGPRVVYYTDYSRIVFTDGSEWHFELDAYGKLWRCWTARPTPEQREAMKWNE